MTPSIGGSKQSLSALLPAVAAGLTLDNWQDAPHNRWAFTNIARFLPTVPIPSAGNGDRRPDIGLDYLSGVEDLRTRLEMTCTDAFVVTSRGQIVAEYYRPGTGPSDRHLLMSVSKSLCGLLVGTLVDDGLVDVDAPMSQYVTELSRSALGGAKVQEVLDMTVDIDYTEDYRDPHAHVQQHDRVAGWRTAQGGDPQDTKAFLAGLQGGRQHGLQFRYCSANTDALGWLVQNVTSMPFADALSERLWKPMGALDSAQIAVDRTGFPIANAGVCCTARDLARVGQLLLDEGEIDGQRVLSTSWTKATSAGGDPAAASGTDLQDLFPNGSYRNQWWVPGDSRGTVQAIGIHGQHIWIDPVTDTVIAKFSSQPDPVGMTWSKIHVSLFYSVCEAVENIANCPA